MSDGTTYRDEELGAALRALDVPEHAPGFGRELRARLADERAAGSARSRPRRRPAPRGRRWAGRAVVAASAAALAAAVLALPLADRVLDLGGTEVASAGEIKTKVRASLASLESLSGVLVFRCGERGCPGQAGERRWTFALTARGDLRLDGPAPREVVTYDASTGVARSAQRSASAGGSTIFYAERRGVAPGPPDLGPPTWELLDELGAFVRALLAADDPRVRDVVHDARPAWRLEVEAVPNAIVPELTGDRFAITVDRETGMPVRVVELKVGVLLRELRIEQLAVNPRLAPHTFALGFPAGAEVLRSSDGFRRIGLEDVEDAVGYAPLVPGFVPDGFELAEVAVAARAAPTGREGGNPPSRDVVSLSYRRGLDQLVVTTRAARAPGHAVGWSDPVATGEGYLDTSESLVLREGALAGARAELVVVPRGVPHLWALHGDLVVTVAGGLARAELVRVAESLRAQRRSG